jgi:hypothetical protein
MILQTADYYKNSKLYKKDNKGYEPERSGAKALNFL